jgi:hypothetical protein
MRQEIPLENVLRRIHRGRQHHLRRIESFARGQFHAIDPVIFNAEAGHLCRGPYAGTSLCNRLRKRPAHDLSHPT